MLGSISLFLAVQFSAFFVWFGDFVAKQKVIVLPILIFIVLGTGGYTFFTSANAERLESSSVSGDIENRYNVIFLISDGIEASEMSVYGSQYDTTPFLNSIKSEFMVFENAYTNNENSTGSIVSLLTGMSPLTTRVVYPPDILDGLNSKRSLPRILGQYNYYRALWAVPHYVDADSQNMLGAFNSNNKKGEFQVHAKEPISDFESNRISKYFELQSLQLWFYRSVWKHHRSILADVFFIEELDNPFSQVAENTAQAKSRLLGYLSDRQRVTNLLTDIDESSQGDYPYFILTHLMRTHGSKFNPDRRVFSAGLEETEGWMSEFYRDSILGFDQVVKQVYNKLKETSQLENTILVVTSDHGPRWSNSKRIPLIIRLPGSSATGNYNVNVQLIDVAPTILDALGLDKPSWMNGDSLIDPGAISPDRFIQSAGVFGNQRNERGVWERKSVGKFGFAKGNMFSVVYCDYFMRSKYPIEFNPELLPDRLGSSDCPKKPKQSIANEAEDLITVKVVN